MAEVAALPKRNQSFVLHGIDDVRIEERPGLDSSKLGPHDAIVAPRKTGICGSDVHYTLHGRIGDFVVKAPMVLGHESAGIVSKVGSAVTSLKPGDAVALEPGESCRMCHLCKHGFYEHCPDMKFAATPPYDGSLCGEYQLPADLCYKLPTGVSLEEGAMVEPLSVGVHAITKVAEMRPNSNICVFGAGPVGLLTMAAAKALGARRVISVDIQPDRLDFAKSYIATDAFLPGNLNDGESKMDYSRRTAKQMTEKFGLSDSGPESIALAVDATGAETCIQTALYLLRTRGTLVQVGMGNPNITIPIDRVISKALVIKGSFRYGPGVYQLAVDLVAQGKIALKPLISHRFAFKDAAKAFSAVAAGRGEDGKVVIKAIIDGPIDSE
jgi:D-xylulose reductase